jgi:hypothetical protein
MNVQSKQVIVTSQDGFQFAVETTSTSESFEKAFAATKSADELSAHGDFTPVSDVTDRPLVQHAPRCRILPGNVVACDSDQQAVLAVRDCETHAALCRAERRWGGVTIIDGDK